MLGGLALLPLPWYHTSLYSHVCMAAVQEGARMRQRLEAWRALPDGAAWVGKRGELPVVQILETLP